VENLQKIMKNKKAISPVLAVLLMIAVAVAAALITYAWVMTYLSSTTSRAGHAIQIQSVAFTGTTATVYTQNVGDGTVILTDAYVDGLLDAAATKTPATLPEGITSTVVMNGAFSSGNDYKLKVVCEDGTFTEGSYTMP
jgi:flagellin-like protein